MSQIFRFLVTLGITLSLFACEPKPTEHERSRASSMESVLQQLYQKDPNSLSSKLLAKALLDNYDKAAPGTESLLSPQMHVFAEQARHNDLGTSLRAALSEQARSAGR